MKIIEVRVITHTPNPPQAFVSVLFDNGTCSPYTKPFPSAEAAEHFAAGMRAAIEWCGPEVHRAVNPS